MGYNLKARIDSDAVNALAQQACCGESSIRVAREMGHSVEPLRGLVVEAMMPAVYRVIAGFKTPPGHSRVEHEDVVQGGMLGLVESVDSFEPSRGYKLETFAWYKIRRRAQSVIQHDHWVVMRPPHRLIEAYMCGRMTTDEWNDYRDKAFGVEGEDELA